MEGEWTLGWIESVGKAIRYIEDHITEELTMDEVAGHVFLSRFISEGLFDALRIYRSRRIRPVKKADACR